MILNQAAKYSNKIVVIKDGNLVAEGNPSQSLMERNSLRDVYNVETWYKKKIY